MRWRSVLFTSAARADRWAGLVSTAADVTVLDLEDAVAVGEKASARAGVGAFVAALSTPAGPPVVLVRVNPLASPWFDDDIAAAASSGAAGVVVPKVAAPGDGPAVAAAWVAAGGAPGPVLLAGLETAAGVESAVASLGDGVWSAAYFGAEDYVADVGGRRRPDSHEVLYARSRVVMAATIAGVAAVDQVVTAYRSSSAFIDDASVARDLGYRGKLCIHPDQVPLAHAAFTPTPVEVERARAVLAAAEAGGGVAAFQGEMVDGPMVRAAHAVLDAAP